MTLKVKNKVDPLNILRVVAFLLIFVLHSKIFIPFEWQGGVRHAWLIYTPAWAGTWIFFMLSGYGIGAGFYSGKYPLTVDGIMKYYIKRLSAIVPLYYFYVIAIAFFVRPDILIPSQENFFRILKLLLFNYQEEFFSLEFGLAWYLTTLIRLYLVAPFGFLLLRKLRGKPVLTSLTWVGLIVAGFVMRCTMGYHIALTGGIWSQAIYKPFYFNLDLFFCAFLLNGLKDFTHKNAVVLQKIGKILVIISLGVLIIRSSHVYYAGDYAPIYDPRALDEYCYIHPSIYLVLVCIYIYLFDIRKNYRPVALSKKSVKKNWLRVIDYFSEIQFPIYLFHSTILMRLASVYDDAAYTAICTFLRIPTAYQMFAKGCILTFIALIGSILWAAVVSKLFSQYNQSRLSKTLYNIDYTLLWHHCMDTIAAILRKLCPEKAP